MRAGVGCVGVGLNVLRVPIACCMRALQYPYERAEKFNKSMRKLGTGADGTTYLDQFRVLVTTIGM